MTYRFRSAGRLATMILDLFGFDAILSPWRTIYIRSAHLNNEALRRHELTHIAQLDRDGPLQFWFLICWWFVPKGHENSPYEIEARASE